MAKVNKISIEITFVKEGLRKEFFTKCLHLSKHVSIGETITVNHFTLSCLDRFNENITYKRI